MHAPMSMIAVLLCSVALQGQTPATQPAATIGKVDPSAGVKDDKSPLLWYDARLLATEGKGWTAVDGFYDRLPTKAEGKVLGAVWDLSKDSAGMCVRFVTDAPTISARWTVRSPKLEMPHMPATGVSGLDLYVRQNGKWVWTGAGRPHAQTNEAPLAEGIPPGEHEYLLYLPLYNGTKSLEIGIPPASALVNPGPRPAKPICFYGTSIVQGGCASRPGMAHVAIVGRKLDMPTINLGFSGQGKMEPEMAALLAELDVAVYVIDGLPNMSGPLVGERAGPFIETLRKARPDTPIVLVENVAHTDAAFLPGQLAEVTGSNGAFRQVYQRLQDAGVSGIIYVPRDNLLGADGEGTVDGTHPTDLGFLRFAEALEPVLSKLLKARP